MVRETNIECVHCGYKWQTKSKLLYVTCPSCHRATPNTTLKNVKEVYGVE